MQQKHQLFTLRNVCWNCKVRFCYLFYMFPFLFFINWWKGKPSGSINCTRKKQPRFYWSCSSDLPFYRPISLTEKLTRLAELYITLHYFEQYTLFSYMRYITNTVTACLQWCCWTRICQLTIGRSRKRNCSWYMVQRIVSDIGFISASLRRRIPLVPYNSNKWVNTRSVY